MKLIVGLGNPGKKYDQTRHNTGFMVIDALAKRLNVSVDNKKFDGLYTKLKYQGEDIILLKPQTYMNESGLSVSQVMKYFKVDSDDVMVVYDDMDMPSIMVRFPKQKLSAKAALWRPSQKQNAKRNPKSRLHSMI